MAINTIDWNSLISEHFGFAEFRGGQADCISALDTYARSLAVFPTGAGKSLCYQLPALAYDGLTLVVSPLIALMKDQIDFLRSRGIEAARLDSTLTLEENRAIYDGLAEGRLKLLYVAPERLKNERFVTMIKRHKISLMAIDEAHCISEWGHNFRPDYLKLPAVAVELNVERILALTATATPAVVKDICRQFTIPDEAAIVTGFYRSNLRIAVTPVTSSERGNLLVRRLKARPRGTTIIYVTLQKTAADVAEMLQQEGYPADYYHAGLKPEDRVAVQERWKNSEGHIVVATIAFGMGIDKADVRYIYHYNLPKSLENYSQEIGRAGRDGLDSVVELFACPEDISTLENFVYGDTPTCDAVHSLCSELTSKMKKFDVSLYTLSQHHDMRPLVLKTTLTYLELLGALREGTPFYNSYRIQFVRQPEQILAQFDADRAEFLKRVFAAGKKGRSWLSVQLGEIAVSMNESRDRIERALGYLADRGDVILKTEELRNRFARNLNCASPEDLAGELIEKFIQREKDEIGRIQSFVNFVEHEGCHANALAAYFGEIRTQPCGVCAQCVTGQSVKLLKPAENVDGDISRNRSVGIVSVLSTSDNAELTSLCQKHSRALGHPRQLSRFLCGLTSPAITSAKLTSHQLYGKLAHVRFNEVLGMAEKEICKVG